jgi:hypothetical protein
MGSLYSKCKKKKKYVGKWVIKPQPTSVQTTLKNESSKNSLHNK